MYGKHTREIGEIKNPLLRIILVTFLAFGWLLGGVSQAEEDPLVKAYNDIQQLKIDINNLNYKDPTQALIDIADQKYNEAVQAKNNKDNADQAYTNALSQEEIALSEMNLTQNTVDQQTTIVATALINKNNAQAELNTAEINLSTANSNLQITQSALQDANNQGVSFQIYPLSRDSYGHAYLASNAGLMCQGSLPYFYTYAGDGRICGTSQNIIGIFRATLTVPQGINDVYFAAYTDDGSRIYVNGVLEASQWQEQGGTWGPYTRHFDVSTNKTLNLEIWWYNGGGPGVMTIGWGYNGIWTGIPSQYLSYGSGATQQQIDDYNAAVIAQGNAQADYDAKLAVYNDKLSIYNQELSKLNTYNQILTDKTNAYNTAVNNTSNALQNKQQSKLVYDQAIIDLNNAISNARNEYNSRWDFEEKQRVAAAIAQALANQVQSEPSVEPTPSPEASLEPSPEPSPEQTQPTDPNPQPTTETTAEATPVPSPTPEISPEPSPEPSSQPTDITPTLTPEPTPSPSETLNSENPPDKNIIEQVVTTIIDNLLALLSDLTNSNTLSNLTQEQQDAINHNITPTPTPTSNNENTPTPNPTNPTVEPTPKPTLTPESTPTPSPTSEVTPIPEPTQTQVPSVEPTPVPVVTKQPDIKVVDNWLNNLGKSTDISSITNLSIKDKEIIANALGINPTELAKVANALKSNPNMAEALSQFTDRAANAKNATMPYTLADATTEVAAENFLQNPIGALTNIDVQVLLSPSEWGKDMTDDQREKAQEVVIPVIIASNLVAAAMTRRK